MYAPCQRPCQRHASWRAGFFGDVGPHYRKRTPWRFVCASKASADLATSQLPLLLSGVRVVIVSPKTPANIGSCLRAAENFEAHDVCVVDPRCDPRCEEVRIVSCGSAVYDSMRVVPSLSEALSDVTGSVGFTRRAGAGRVTWPSPTSLLESYPALLPPLPDGAIEGGFPRQMQFQQSQGNGSGSSSSSSSSSDGSPQQLAQRIAALEEGAVDWEQHAGQSSGSSERLALVFGREESGLLESELLLCSHACAIPTGRSQPSLNLSHAVAVVLSQLFEKRTEQLGGPALFEQERSRFIRERALAPVQQAELEALLSRCAALLERAGISAEDSRGGEGNHGRRKQAMGHLRALLLRGRASTAEVRAMHFLCKELEGKLKELGG